MVSYVGVLWVCYLVSATVCVRREGIQFAVPGRAAGSIADKARTPIAWDAMQHCHPLDFESYGVPCVLHSVVKEGRNATDTKVAQCNYPPAHTPPAHPKRNAAHIRFTFLIGHNEQSTQIISDRGVNLVGP